MNLKSTFRSLTASIAFAAVLSSAGPAFAQEASDDGESLTEIIVTAQRRAENQKDVPISVATLQGDALAAVSGAGADVRAL